MSAHAQPLLGPYTPTLILHGGAGAIARAHLPPALYARYEAALSAYAVSTRALLQGGAEAVEAACHAVGLMEDDALFNCGRGSVFTEAGGIEMEASVMVCSVDPAWEGEGSAKRGAAVSLITETRHPVLLAREVLAQGEDGWAELGGMHCQRSGRAVEEWGWGKGLERKGRDWFWTRRRWEEHLRGLEGREIGAKRGTLGDDVDVHVDIDVDDDDAAAAAATDEHANDHLGDHDGVPLPSQGTVGCVCMDSWGTLAVATSTGGLTNKKPGRIGDTPTLGAGFWAESWDEEIPRPLTIPVPSSLPSTRYGSSGMGPLDLAAEELGNALAACLPSFSRATRAVPRNKLMLLPTTEISPPPYTSPTRPSAPPHKRSRSPPRSRPSRRAVAMSGTGNGDSFLRTSAARTAAAMARFSPTSLSQAISNVAGYDGELQQSAGERWGQTGEGEGGIIGIEAVGGSTKGHLVAEFNCSGMWRAWVDEKTGSPRVMVFREEYQ